MSEYIIQSGTLSGIGDQVRRLTGSDATLTPVQMGQALEGVSIPAAPRLQELVKVISSLDDLDGLVIEPDTGYDGLAQVVIHVEAASEDESNEGAFTAENGEAIYTEGDEPLEYDGGAA